MLVEPLTPREYQVLQRLAEGLTAKEASAVLHVGESSVRLYIRRVYAKLQARNAPHAVAIGYQRGLLGGYP